MNQILKHSLACAVVVKMNQSIGVEEEKKERFGWGGGSDDVEGMAIDEPLDAIVENEAKSG